MNYHWRHTVYRVDPYDEFKRETPINWLKDINYAREWVKKQELADSQHEYVIRSTKILHTFKEE
jgi:hypothetical protein